MLTHDDSDIARHSLLLSNWSRSVCQRITHKHVVRTALSWAAALASPRPSVGAQSQFGQSGRKANWKQVRGGIIFQLGPLGLFAGGELGAGPIAEAQRYGVLRTILYSYDHQFFVFIKKLKPVGEKLCVRWIRVRDRVTANKLGPQPIDVAMMRIKERIAGRQRKVPHIGVRIVRRARPHVNRAMRAKLQRAAAIRAAAECRKICRVHRILAAAGKIELGIEEPATAGLDRLAS